MKHNSKIYNILIVTFLAVFVIDVDVLPSGGGGDDDDDDVTVGIIIMMMITVVMLVMPMIMITTTTFHFCVSTVGDHLHKTIIQTQSNSI